MEGKSARIETSVPIDSYGPHVVAAAGYCVNAITVCARIVAAPPRSNTMVSPSFATASACRNEPGPLSFVLVTGMMAAWVGTIAHKSAMQITGNLLDAILVFTQLYRY
jgi:hypothetical protein